MIKWNSSSSVAMAEVSAFLASLFFAALLLIVQTNGPFNHEIYRSNLLGWNFSVNSLQIVSCLFSICIVTFTFSAIRFAGASSHEASEKLNASTVPAYTTFRIGLISMLVSFCAILAFIDIFVLIIGIIMIILIIGYFSKK
jgi:hypothetical protein